MSDTNPPADGAGNRHGAARDMAEAAFEAERAGDTDRADALFEQAEKTDPEAVIGLLEEQGGGGVSDDPAPEPGSETVVPGSDAPSRAGISGSGSGADNQGL